MLLIFSMYILFHTEQGDEEDTRSDKMKKLSPSEPQVAIERSGAQLCFSIRIEVKRQYSISYVRYLLEKQGFRTDIIEPYILRASKCVLLRGLEHLVSVTKSILVELSNRLETICAEVYMRVKHNVCESIAFQRKIRSGNNILSASRLDNDLVVCLYNNKRKRSIIRIIPDYGNNIDKLDLLLIPRSLYVTCGDTSVIASYLADISRRLIKAFGKIHKYRNDERPIQRP